MTSPVGVVRAVAQATPAASGAAARGPSYTARENLETAAAYTGGLAVLGTSGYAGYKAGHGGSDGAKIGTAAGALVGGVTGLSIVSSGVGGGTAAFGGALKVGMVGLTFGTLLGNFTRD